MGAEQEGRKYIRLGARLLTFVTFPKSGQVLRGLTRDISGGGVCVLVDEDVKPEMEVEVAVRMPDREAPLTFTAVVVWSRVVEAPTKSYEKPKTEAGLKFVKIDQKEHALIMQYAALNAIPPETLGR